MRGDGNETITLPVSGTEQEIHFRRGRTPGDEESINWYIVHWREIGTFRSPDTSRPAAGGVAPPVGADAANSISASHPLVARVTWGVIKAIFR
jgi:hypothetical protein